MRLLTGKEIYSIVTGQPVPFVADIKISPFDIRYLNPTSYSLHAGQTIIVHHSDFDETKILDPKESIILLPNLLYTVKIMEKISVKNIVTCVYGPNVVSVNYPKKPGETFSVRIAPTEYYVLYPNQSTIAEVKFILYDDRNADSKQQARSKDDCQQKLSQIQNFNAKLLKIKNTKTITKR